MTALSKRILLFLCPLSALLAGSFSPCDLNQDGVIDVKDVQRVINEAQGVTKAVHDLNQDGKVNVVDVQIVLNGALQRGCAVNIGPVPTISALSARYALTGATLSLTVTGTNLAGAAFAFGPAGITVNSANVNAAGTSATLSITAGASAGTFSLVATTGTGFSNGAVSILLLTPSADDDGDGLTNAQELALGTDPENSDTDGDGMPDGWEVFYHLNPLDPSDAAKPCTAGDGHTNLYEFQNGLDPTNPDRTAPSVASTNPPANSTTQPPSATIVVVFNKPVLSAAQIAQLRGILANEGTDPTVTLGVGFRSIPGTFTLSADGTQLTFTHTADLAPLTFYNMQIAGFRSLAGVPMANFSFSFQTNNQVDTTQSKVLLSSPGNSVTNVPLNAAISLVFSKPIDPTTITTPFTSQNPNFTVESLITGQPIAGAISFDATGKTLTFVATAGLPAGGGVTLFVNFVNPGYPLMTDHSGIAAVAYELNFQTGLKTATQPPAVTGNSPLNGDAGIPANVQVVLQFSEPIDEIAATGAIQFTENGAPIPGSFLFTGNDQVVAFTSTNPIAPGTVTASVATSLTGAAGTPLTSPYSFSFTVASPAVTTFPSLTASNPPNGSTAVPRNVLPGFSFDTRLDLVTTLPALQLTNMTTGQLAPGIASASVDRQSLTFRPNAPLQGDTNFCLLFVNPFNTDLVQASDLAGNLAVGQTCFTTGTATDTAAPTVTAVNPPAGAINVALNAGVMVQLSEPVDTVAFPAASLSVQGAGVAVAGTAKLSADQTTITFTPASQAGFAANTIFTVSLAGVTDFAGNAAAPFSSSFTTGVAVDTNPPNVLSSVPADQSTGVAINSTVVVTFDKPVNPITVNAADIAVTLQPAGTPIGGALSLNNAAAGAVVTFTPSSPLPALSSINLTVANVQDFAGNGNAPYTATFTTANTLDTSPLLITSVTPADGSASLGLNTVVNLTFNKPLDPTVINDTNFGMFQGDSRVVTTLIANSPDDRTVSLTATLTAGATFTVIAGSGIHDLAGNHLADFRSTFATAATPVGPSVVTMRPANGASGVPNPASIALYVNKPLNPATVNGAFRAIDSNGVIVSGQTQVLGDGQTIEFTPVAPFAAGEILVDLDATATDLAGNPVSAFQAEFSTVAGIQPGTPPIVIWAPSNGLATNGVIDIQFSKPIDATTVNAVNFAFFTNNEGTLGPNLPIGLSLYNAQTVRLAPGASLTPGTLYDFTISTGVKDTTGLALAHSFISGVVALSGPDNTQPRVATITPPDGSHNVGDNAPVYLHFSKPVDPATISAATVRISSGGTAISPFSISLSNSNQDVVFTPLTALPDNATITVTVSGIQDMSANSIIPFTASFTTRNGPVLANTNVVSTNPINGASGVPLNSALTLQFDAPVDPVTVNTADLPVTDLNTTQAVAGTWTLSGNATVASFAPNAPFAVNHFISVSWGNAVHDLAGNFLTTGSLQFVTAFQPSSTPPVVTLSTPVDGQTAVPINALVEVAFSTPVATASVQDVTLLANGNVVSGVLIALSAGNTVLTLTPPTLLLANTPYTIDIAGVTDLAGNVLSPAVTRSFTTGPGGLLTVLSVTASNPPNSFTQPVSNVGTNAVVTVAFNQRLNPLTVDSSTMILYDYTDSLPVAGTVSLSADGRNMVFTPAAPLKNQTEYEWNVLSVQDQVGNGVSGDGLFITGLAADHTAPAITAANPPNGAQNVGINVTLAFLAGEPVNPLSAGNSSVTLKAGNTTVAGAVSLEPDFQTIVFQPAALLAPATTYTATLAGMTDVEGNAVAPYSITFTTAAAGTPDTTPPAIVTTSPADGVTGVAPASPIVLTFSKNLDPLTVNAATVPIILAPSGNQAAGVYSLDNSTANGIVTFTPLAASPLPGSTIVTVNVNGVLDYAGNPSTTLSFSFTTAAASDTVPPKVTAVTPPNLATGVGGYGKVTLNFSKSLDPTTLTAASVALFAGTTLLRPAITSSQDGTSVTLGPITLPPNSNITVVATHDVTDLSGNHLADFSSQFTTAPAANTLMPQVLNMRPAQSATRVPLNNPLFLFFNEPMDSASTLAAFDVSQNGLLVSGNAVFSQGNQLLTFTPSAPYLAGAAVVVFLAASAAAANGATLGQNYYGSFTAITDPTNSPPSLVGTSIDSANGIPVNPVIEVEFDKPLDPATVNTTNVKVDIGAVAIQVSLVNGNIIRAVPTSTLTPNALHRIQVFGVADLQGRQALGLDRFFATGSGPADTSQPRVVFVTPSAQQQGVPVNAPIFVHFSEVMNPLSPTPATVSLTVNGAPVSGLYFMFGSVEGSQDLFVYPYIPLPQNAPVTLSISNLEDLAGNLLIPYSSSFQTGSGVDFTAPSVVRTSPADQSVALPVNSVITLELSKPIDPSTVSSDSLPVTDQTIGTGVPLPGAYSVMPNGKAIVFAPSANFAPGDEIQAVWGNTLVFVTDLAGNALTSGAVHFTTSTAPVTTPPSLVAAVPASGLAGVATNVVPHLLFDRPIDGATLGGIALKAGGVAANFAAALSNGNRTLSLMPPSLLAPSTAYTLTVAGIADVAGNLLASPLTISFTTGPGADLVPPQVTASSPASGDTVASSLTTVTVTFSEPLDPGTAIATNCSIGGPSGTVPATLSLSADGLTLTLTLSAPLAPNAGYQINLAGITDLAGNTLPGTSIFFNTGN